MGELLDVNLISQSQLLSVKDKDLRRYLYVTGSFNRCETEYFKIDNSEKVGYYYKTNSLRINKSGTPYKVSNLCEWIVYDKSSKKVKVSKNNENVLYQVCLERDLNFKVIKTLVPRRSSTFIKKLLEGKIKTLIDIAKYHRSYSLKDKTLSLSNILKFACISGVYYLQFIKDPENLNACNYMEVFKLSHDYIQAGLPKVTIEECSKTQDMYGEWRREQDKRYVKEQRQGTSTYRSVLIEELELRVRTFSGQYI